MRNDHISDQSEKTRQTVRDGYSEIAVNSKGCCGCSDPQQFAEAIGYSKQELELLPDGANMGLSCGNPTAIADLKPGQVVLDLGSGGGFDVFVAAKKVGQEGRVIGVDMTPEMISKSRQSIPVFAKKTNLNNAEFRLGEIEHLPLADNSIDVVVSNCVINLSPDKQRVWSEIARVLKPGGKACVSDLALKQELPEAVKAAAQALIGCVAGAVRVEATVEMMRNVGLNNIEIGEKPYNIDVMDDCNDNLYGSIRQDLPEGMKLGDYVISVDFVGYKEVKTMDKKTKELIAIGASVACNCHPCVKFHTGKASEFKIEPDLIKQAIAVGKMVRRGAAEQMDELIKEKGLAEE